MNGQAPSASGGGGGGGGRMPRRAMSLANDGRPGSPLARRSYVQLKNWSTEKRMTDTLHSRVKSVSRWSSRSRWLFSLRGKGGGRGRCREKAGALTSVLVESPVDSINGLYFSKV